MATETRSFAVSVPAGTAQATPQVTNLTMPPRIVTAVRWRVPPGPRGALGWALSMAGQHVVPWGNGNWIVADDEYDRVQFTEAPTSGAWQLIAYNTGLLPHSVYLIFDLEPVGAKQGAPGVTLLDVNP